jgi:beta-aspartyl-peptidase (threonine type)
MKSFSLMIHGGAGATANKPEVLKAIKSVLTKGTAELKAGASALDAVEYCVSLLEDDPQFNAGRGAALNAKGEVDLDAAIMNGDRLQAGAIAGVQGIKNPVELARAVLDNSPHVFLIGKGAMEFARTQDVATKPPEYFITQKRKDQWEAAKTNAKIVLDHSDYDEIKKKYGTVGAVALDQDGNLAAATSTGGIVGKQFGRVSDTSLIGAGTYAENGLCAISCTGVGEQFIRTVLAKHAADIMRFQQTDAQATADAAIKYLVETVKGLGGLILVDAAGNCAKAYSTPGLVWGSAGSGKTLTVGLN